jgi:phage portal protein BeeE
MSLLQIANEPLDVPAPIEKGLADARWGASSVGSGQPVSVQAIRAMSKGLTPKQCFELSVPVRTAVTAICENLAKAKWRHFNRDGDEIVAGPLFKLFQNPSPGIGPAELTRRLTAWWLIQNEMGVAVLPDITGESVSGMLILDPTRLLFGGRHEGRQLSHLWELDRWKYRWTEEASDVTIPASLVAFAHGFNPYDNCRGLSPFVTGQNEAAGNYFITRYNKEFFENGAVPSHVVRLPKGTSPANKEAFVAEYTAMYGRQYGQAHKAAVVVGDDMDILPVSTAQQDGSFPLLQQWNASQIGALFHVPDGVMGLNVQTRHETAAIQRQQFYEMTLSPIAAILSEMMQNGITDRWFAGEAKKEYRTDAGLRARAKRAYERALAAQPESKVITILDTDAMPIMAEIKRSVVSLVKDYRENLDLSVNEACAELGIDLPEPSDPKNVKLRDLIMSPGGRICLNDPQLLQPAAAGPENTQSGDGKTDPNKDRVNDKPKSSVNPKVTDKKKGLSAEDEKAVRVFLREYRKHALDRSDLGKPPKLADADAMVEQRIPENLRAAMKAHVRRDILALRKEPAPDIVKAHLNDAYDRHFFRALA